MTGAALVQHWRSIGAFYVEDNTLLRKCHFKIKNKAARILVLSFIP